MTLIIELTPESEERLNCAAERAGVKPEDFARRLIEAIPAAQMEADRTFTARELWKLSTIERETYLRAAAERAAAEYEADLALPAPDRVLTAFSTISGADFQLGQHTAFTAALIL